MKTFGSSGSNPYAKVRINFGYNLHRFGLGFSINRYNFDLDLAFFWISVEW